MDSNLASSRSGLFLRIGDYAARRKGFVFAVTALLVFMAVLLGSRLRLDTDILEMVPRGNVKVDAFKSSLRDFGGIDYLLVLLEAPPGGSVEDYEEFADRFAAGPGAQRLVGLSPDRLGDQPHGAVAQKKMGA